ncbi:unnamed protein product [Parnassius apollo]|uniref:(apollo) hypothetical protein n=1 Tax=Parnassius apollo TaxID=110799 RepID=A0A8S3WSZ0_PARAO|nr:unnamed protein product [Parnassius apollo]
MLMAGALPAEPEGLLALGALPGQKDTTWTKLFVGGLPYHTTDKSLREHFAVYGDIEEAVVITDRQTSKSRGYGFVIMGDRAAAERACKDPNPIIDGRKANVNLAILGAKPRGNLAPVWRRKKNWAETDEFFKSFFTASLELKKFFCKNLPNADRHILHVMQICGQALTWISNGLKSIFDKSQLLNNLM